jgi:hypothetical protein
MILAPFDYYVPSIEMNMVEHIDDTDLARRMYGKYLRNEWKYDKFGAQGKLILLLEVLYEDGIDLAAGNDCQKLINEVFPRTFYCEQKREIDPPLKNTILKYFKKLEREFTEQGLPENVVQYICVFETAEKFCLPDATIKEIASQ